LDSDFAGWTDLGAVNVKSEKEPEGLKEEQESFQAADASACIPSRVLPFAIML
jgi:hypothetical protein